MRSKQPKNQREKVTKQLEKKEKVKSLLNSVVAFLMIVFVISTFMAFYNSLIKNKTVVLFYIIFISTFIGLIFIQLYKDSFLKKIKK